MTAAIVQLQKKEEAKFICSSCGADRGCQCNAPAIEKLALIKEQTRQRVKAHRDRKAEENQQPSNVTEGYDTAASSADHRKAEYADADEWNDHDILPKHQESAFLIRADQARQFAVYSGEPTPSLAAQARLVAKAWSDLATHIEVRCGNQT